MEDDDEGEKENDASLPGHLLVHIIKARNLAAMDGVFNKSSDPFCMVELDNNRKRTHVRFSFLPCPIPWLIHTSHDPNGPLICLPPPLPSLTSVRLPSVLVQGRAVRSTRALCPCAL